MKRTLMETSFKRVELSARRCRHRGRGHLVAKNDGPRADGSRPLAPLACNRKRVERLLLPLAAPARFYNKERPSCPQWGIKTRKIPFPLTSITVLQPCSRRSFGMPLNSARHTTRSSNLILCQLRKKLCIPHR
jgi:hypothetical protein